MKKKKNIFFCLRNDQSLDKQDKSADLKKARNDVKHQCNTRLKLAFQSIFGRQSSEYF